MDALLKADSKRIQETVIRNLIATLPYSPVKREGSYTVPSIHFCYADGGRASSRRPKQSNDCTVRAVAIACQLPYDEAYDLLASAGRKPARGFRLVDAIKKFKTVNGFSFDWVSFPAMTGHYRLYPGEFSKQFPTGTYIVKTAKHVNTVIDGIWYDLSRVDGFRCVYGAWKIEK